MLRFLIIFGLVAYVLYKFGSLFYRAGANSQQQFRNPQRRRPIDGNVNIDIDPNEKKRKGSSKAGEYVDYEEVK
jgi:hypothetical protein